MLSKLNIKNIALIDDIELRLQGGLNILSGETGAGKSIIIDSLNFVLGERADKSLIRHGENSAVVEAVFEEYRTPAMDSAMNELGIACEDELILSRVMNVAGKNECRVNGRAVTLASLKGLTALLVDIHGQHEHQSLLNPTTHIGLLDAFGGAETSKKLTEVSLAHKAFSELSHALSKIGDSGERERKIDILSYQIEEINSANVQETELDELLAERKKLQNAGTIADALKVADDALNGNGSYTVVSLLNAAARALDGVADFDSDIAALASRLTESKIEIRDVADTVADISAALDFNGNRMEAVEERISKIRALFKKYGGDYAGITAFVQRAEQELFSLKNADEEVAELEKKLSLAGDKLVIAASGLTKIRKKNAEIFRKKIEKELADVGMTNTTFEVAFNLLGEDGNPNDVSENGADSVEFLISPNLGEPLKPLAKIISGGEMSRFMLALKNITASLENISTMVFDEIDTGISGAIAEVVAQKLYNISHERQVVAVTHLPQLASMADVHFLISKHVENGKTKTRLTLLDYENCILEIARLVGGSTYSSFAAEHARTMKEHAATYKKKFC